MNDSADILLSCAALVKGYGPPGNDRINVLRALDFRLARGESVAITGASGSGKSTFLHLIAGLEKLDAGTIFYRLERIDNLGEKEMCKWRNKEAGFIYQFHHLLPEFSVLENVAMPLLVRNDDHAKAMARAAELLMRVGMAERMRHRPGELSGGERQRVAICRALISRPRLILADEPTGNLDNETANAVAELMLGLQASEGSSLIVATHSEEMAQRLSKIYRLLDGKLCLLN